MTPAPELRVGLIADSLEEGWPSMDLVAETLFTHLDRSRVTPILLRPTLTPRIARLVGANGRPVTSDRIINRFWDYPRWIRSRTGHADVFHLIDHSYAHLARDLPPGRIVITCHDADAFRPLVNGVPRESKLPRFLVRRILDGLRRADIVACVSETTRRELVDWRLVSADRTEIVANGVDECFSPEPDADADRQAEARLGSGQHIDVLHVGSSIPRKRIDVLLQTLRLVARAVPTVRLVRVGGSLTPAQQQLASELGVAGRILALPFLERRVLAAVYRRSVLTLLPSEREGFGLPLIEAMASGTPVVATSLDVLREVGGDAGVYVPLGAASAWCDAVVSLLNERAGDPGAWTARREACVRQAARYSWPRYVSRMTEIYERLAGR